MPGAGAGAGAADANEAARVAPKGETAEGPGCATAAAVSSASSRSKSLKSMAVAPPAPLREGVVATEPTLRSGDAGRRPDAIPYTKCGSNRKIQARFDLISSYSPQAPP